MGWLLKGVKPKYLLIKLTTFLAFTGKGRICLLTHIFFFCLQKFLTT